MNTSSPANSIESTHGYKTQVLAWLGLCIPYSSTMVETIPVFNKTPQSEKPLDSKKENTRAVSLYRKMVRKLQEVVFHLH
jgi:hypothetical protein